MHVVPSQPPDRPHPLTAPPPSLRRPSATDGPALWALAGDCGLDQNSPYAYALWGEYFAATSVVAVDDDDHAIGFISGFRAPGEPDTVFVWQVAVSPHHRRRGVAGQMLDDLVATTGASTIEATVTPSNAPSLTLFRALGERHGTSVDERLLFGEDLLLGGHEPEVLLRIPVGETNPTTDRN